MLWSSSLSGQGKILLICIFPTLATSQISWNWFTMAVSSAEDDDVLFQQSFSQAGGFWSLNLALTSLGWFQQRVCSPSPQPQPRQRHVSSRQPTRPQCSISQPAASAHSHISATSALASPLDPSAPSVSLQPQPTATSAFPFQT